MTPEKYYYSIIIIIAIISILLTPFSYIHRQRPTHQALKPRRWRIILLTNAIAIMILLGVSWYFLA